MLYSIYDMYVRQFKIFIEKVQEVSNVWKKNLVSWNDRAHKFDIRDWDADNQKMGKKITLSTDELRELKKILNDIDL